MQNKYIKVSVILITTVGVIAAFYFYWRDNSLWRAAREEQKKYAAAEAFMNRYDAAMKADTWGGKTPKETLQLFIAALEKGDLDLAAKYFMPETNENDPDYLTRRKWEEGLKEAQKDGRVPVVIQLVKNMEKSKRNLGTAESVEYVTYDENGIVENSLLLTLNRASSIWKIESL